LTWIGAALAAVGVAVIAYPAIGPQVVGAVAGWLLWFAGAVMIVVSLLLGAPRARLGALLASAVAVAGGAFLLFNPTAGALAATLLIAAVLILEGAFELALALDLRPLSAWRWLLASSIASAVAGVVVAAGAAGSQAVLALLLGLAFASSGVALLVLGGPRRGHRTSRARAGGGAPGTHRT
jgi:uncharacterized membrane protein HdeD (DUF308 family)